MRYSETDPANLAEQKVFPEGIALGQVQLKVALNHMTTALELLDAQGAPAQIGARLDHAIQELIEHLGLATK